MPLSQVQVGVPAWLQDSTTPNMLAGKSGEGVVAELHGQYFTQNYRGRLWHASITTASAIPVQATNSTPNFAIWNPSGNATSVVLVRMNVGFSAGTGIAGQIGYAYLNAGPYQLATAGPVSAFTAGPAIQMGLVGSGYGGKIQFGTAATLTGTGISVGTVYKWSNLSQGAPITSTATMYNLFEDFNGTVIIPPGIMFYPVASTAIAETGMITVSAYEIPFP